MDKVDNMVTCHCGEKPPSAPSKGGDTAHFRAEKAESLPFISTGQRPVEFKSYELIIDRMKKISYSII